MSKETFDSGKQSTKDYLTVMIADQRFGIPVLQVQDVLRPQKVTRIPLSAPEVAGSLNLRGRIVTAIDVRKRLKLDSNNDNDGLAKEARIGGMSVVVEYKQELYSLIIDHVGDVLSLSDQHFEKNPGTLDPLWREISLGIYQLKGELMVVMDVPKILEGIN